jgi:DNA-binding IclR family transcriptional regulator
MKLNNNYLFNRCFIILQNLQWGHGLRFGEISKLLNPISPSTLTRILKTLAELKYIKQDGSLYHLNQNPLDRASIVDPQMVQKELENLSLSTGLSSGLFSRLGNSSMKIVGKFNCAEGVNFGPQGREMTLMPSHGFAKIFLAWENLELQNDLYQRLRTEFVSNKILVHDALQNQYKAIRETGQIVEEAERQENVFRYVIGIPREKSVLALGLYGDIHSLKRKDVLFSALTKTSQKISDAIIFNS